MKKLKTPAQRPRKAPSNQTGGTAWGKKLAAEISRMAQAADMKKLILLNFPYIIAFYMVEKAAWLYRHCNGDSVVDRLMVLFMNFGLAYKSVLPSFNPFDLMVGLVGAAALKAVIYFKGKNAKKYRQGEEYGSARWGNQKDIEPFIDPVFENNVILTQTERLMMSGRPKHPKYARNKNVIVIGGSGSGKTRFYVKPNLMQMPEKVSYVLTDPKQLKKLGMLIVQDQVWNRVTINRNSKKNTRYYIDEFHLLLKEEQTAAYSVEIWKRFRKWGGVPTGITQNIKDLLASREIENIFENSDFIYMLNQASGDRQILAKQLNISPFQLSYVTNSNEGEGLLFYGNTIIPFKDKFDTSLKLYSLMTTKPNEMGKYKEKKEA